MDDETGREDGAVSDGDFSASGWQLPSDEVLSLDHVFDALGHPRRRYICYVLPKETEWALADLATKIAARENDVPESAVDPDQRERVYVSLYHAHLPKLVDAGIVVYDEASKTVRPGENADLMLAALSGVENGVEAAREEHERGEMDEERS